MASRKFSALTVAFMAVLVAAIATTTESAPAHALPSNHRIVPTLTFAPTRCYRRSQVCCYKYVKCGVVCRVVRCKTIRKCVLRAPFTNKCLAHKKVRVCIKRCFAKLCKRVSCSPLRVVKRSSAYIAPKPFILAKNFVENEEQMKN